MPSVLIGNQSGGQPLVSGNVWSGYAPKPQGGVQLRLDRNASGNVYYGLSGGITIGSGGFFLSGGGNMDGTQLGPGDSAWIPRIGTGMSGGMSIYVAGEATVSGQGRLYYEVY